MEPADTPPEYEAHNPEPPPHVMVGVLSALAFTIASIFTDHPFIFGGLSFFFLFGLAAEWLFMRKRITDSQAEMALGEHGPRFTFTMAQRAVENVQATEGARKRIEAVEKSLKSVKEDSEKELAEIRRLAEEAQPPKYGLVELCEIMPKREPEFEGHYRVNVVLAKEGSGGFGRIEFEAAVSWEDGNEGRISEISVSPNRASADVIPRGETPPGFHLFYNDIYEEGRWAKISFHDPMDDIVSLRISLTAPTCIVLRSPDIRDSEIRFSLPLPLSAPE